MATLSRGTALVVGRSEGPFLAVARPGAAEAWVEADQVERESDREAREKRTAAVASFPSIPGRMVAAAPVLLAPEWGAPRWGALEEGDPVEVLVPCDDFLGVKLLGIPLAFVPAHAVRFVPPPTPEPSPTPAGEGPAVPPGAGPGGAPVEVPIGTEPSRPPASSEGPYAALPPGAEPPELVRRVDPVYPELARRAGLSGVVELKLVVEADGSVGRVEPVGSAPAPLVEAARAAVQQWKYSPARLSGRPIAVEKTVRVTFRPAGSG